MGYAIACGHRLTAWAAGEILRSGGTAIDAAIAGYATSWVTEPCMSGPGGGGLAVISMDGTCKTVDFFCKTPGVRRPVDEVQLVPITVDFGGATDVFHIGQGAVAVPGAIEGLFTMHAMGGRLPVEELLKPAIEIALNGHVIEPFQHYDLVLLRDILWSAGRGRELYFNGDDIKPLGAEIRLPHLADFMDYLGREGKNAFYDGEVARKIVQASRDGGGHLTAEDLMTYSAVVEVPLELQYHGHRTLVHRKPGIGSWLLARTLEYAGELTRDGQSMPGALLEAVHRARASRAAMHKGGFALKEGGTSHLSIVDDQGNMVSLSMSIGEGSGCFIDGTDIQLNNMLGEMDLLPDGLHNWQPGVRMQTMMAPALGLCDAEGLRYALGSGGSTRIPYVIAQVLHHLACGKTPEEAVTIPRAHLHDGVWQAEPGFVKPTSIPGEAWNEWRETNLYFGGVHTAMQTPRGWLAAADARRYGVTALSQ